MTSLYKFFLLTFAVSFFTLHPVLASENSSKTVPLRYQLDLEGSFIPYDRTEDSRAGIFHDLVELIFNEAMIPYEKVMMPTKRAAYAMEEGHLDFDFVSPKWFPSGELGQKFVGSQPYMVMMEYFVTLPKNAKAYSKPTDAYGNVVGTVGGYIYFDDNRFTRMDFRSEKELLMGLARERFEVVILEEMTARYWSKKLGIPIALASIHTQGEMVLRVRKEHSWLMPRINGAIEVLRSQNKIELMLDRYR